MGFLKDQTYVSAQTPMPTDNMGASQSILTAPSETVALYYSNAGTRTVDAGQAAGVAVTGQIANKCILDAGGGNIATKGDTSLAFTGDCFTTEKSFPTAAYETVKDGTWLAKLTAITAGYSNGWYCIDSRNGTFYGVKATATTSLTSVTYKINREQTGGSSTLPSDVNINQIGGVSVVVDDAAFTPATSTGFVAFGFADETGSDSVNEGDAGAFRMTLNRRQIIASQTLDDAAFGIGTEYVTAVGMVADETGSDSVDEGDIGAPRMTLNRRQINAGMTLDDAAFGIGTEYVQAVGFLADETTSDSVDEGDIGLPRMSLDRRVYTVSANTVIGHGVTTVTTAGTDVALAASTPCKRVTIMAQTDNTGVIAVGASGVDATVATGTGVLLQPGDAFELDVTNLASVYIDSTVNTDGVRYTYFN
jgi:hypothetical protein